MERKINYFIFIFILLNQSGSANLDLLDLDPGPDDYCGYGSETRSCSFTLKKDQTQLLRNLLGIQIILVLKLLDPDLYPKYDVDSKP
jgi:hypothetical protein